MHDVTERKESEKRAREFYSTVSHELRTPLTSIKASLGIANGGIAGDISPEPGHLLTIASGECARLVIPNTVRVAPFGSNSPAQKISPIWARPYD